MKIIKFKTKDDIEFEQTLEMIKELVKDIEEDKYESYVFVGIDSNNDFDIIHCGEPLTISGLLNAGNSYILDKKILYDHEEEGEE